MQDSQAQSTTLKYLIETLQKEYNQEGEMAKSTRTPNMVKIVKPAKVPTWTRNMTLDTFKRQLVI